jgi:ABC-type branched-subunit amino acid transport system substrate-binding protein
MGSTRSQDSSWRHFGLRTTRGLLGGSLVAGLLVVGGGSILAPSVAGAAAAGTCPAATPVTKSELSAAPGVTSKTITVGNVSIISGPVPGLFEGASIGVKAYFDYINSKGGVHGRKLMVDTKDDAFSGQQNETETQQSVASDLALVGSFSLFDGYGCAALSADPAIPDVSVTLDPATNNLPNVFSAQPLATGSGLGPLEYYKKHYPKDTKVGSLVSNVSSSLQQWAGRVAALKHVGYSIAYVRDVGPLESDFTTDVINMRKDGVNVVDLTALDWQVAAIFMQNAAAQNWHPALVISGGPVYADQFISHAGGAAAVNGVQIGQAQALYLGQDSSHVPAVKQFLTYVKKINPSWTPDLFTLYGWASAVMFVQALQGAGTHPTRGTLLAQLKKVTSFSAGGLIAPDNPAQKKPSGCFVLLQIKNGQFQRVLPKTSGFDCNGTYFYANGSAS